MNTITSRLTRAAPLFDALYAAAIAVVTVLLAYNHFQIITAPAPIELFEGTMVYFTELFARGQNPFTFEMQPAATYVYTPLYNIVVAPLTHLFGNSVELHRIVSGICILASCALIFIAARWLGAKWVDSAAAAALTYAALIYYATPIASTGALGEALFLAAILVPFLLNWSAPSLVASALLGILAFYSKQYFLLSLGIVSVYVFLSVSKTRAVIYAAGAATALIASIAAIQITGPYFLADTFFAVSASTQITNALERLLAQLLLFSQLYAGLLLLIAALAVMALGTAFRNKSWKRILALRITPLSAPLFATPISYPWICLAIGTAAIVFSLGQNGGQWMSYLFQLMSPFLALALCASPALKTAWRPLLLPLFLFSLVSIYVFLPKNFEVSADAWRRIREVVCASNDPYVSPFLVLAPTECDKPVYDGGHASYFSLATLPGALAPRDPSRQPAQMWRAYVDGLQDGVRTQRFDVLVTLTPKLIFLGEMPGALNGELIRQHYRRTEVFDLSFSDRPGAGDYTVRIWRPRRETGASDPQR